MKRDTPPHQAESTPRQPDIVLVLADDLGWADLSHHGGTTATPHLDALFEAGVELGRFLVSPRCSPTRAALLTGRSPMRSGIGPWTVPVDSDVHLSLSEVTLAEDLKEAGYETALVGKWHLGRVAHPLRQGFDHFFGCLGAAVDEFDQTRPGDGLRDWWLNWTPSVETGVTTHLVRDAAVTMLRRPRTKPLFLTVSFTSVHRPLQAPSERVEALARSARTGDEAVYAAMVSELDDAVGAIVRSIEEAGRGSETIVFFASDNGAVAPGSNLPYRAGKGFAYEGGVRVPAVIRWKDRLPARVLDGLVAAEDVLPTLLALAGTAPPQRLLDGIDLASALSEGASPRTDYAWMFRGGDAFTTARWKLIRRAHAVELFDLVADPSEVRDVSGRFGEVVGDLTKRLDAWERTLVLAPQHVPITSARGVPADPAGDVLVVRADVAEGEATWANLTGWCPLGLHPGDRLELDLFIEPESDVTGFRLGVTTALEETRLENAVDQYGVPNDGRSAMPRAEGDWSRRIYGLGNLAPRTLGRLRIQFTRPGTYSLRFDNLRVRRASGETVDLPTAPGVLPDSTEPSSRGRVTLRTVDG